MSNARGVHQLERGRYRFFENSLRYFNKDSRPCMILIEKRYLYFKNQRNHEDMKRYFLISSMQCMLSNINVITITLCCHV